jgi:2-O-methyltransferase
MFKTFTIFFICLSSFCQAEITKITTNSYEVMNFISQYLPSDPIILEAGAFDGTDTELLAHIWPKSQIHSFEPHPILYPILCNKVHHYKNLHTYNFALGDKNDQVTFYGSRIDDIYSGSSSVLPPKEHLKFERTKFNDQFNVSMLTLDEWAQIYNVDYLDFMWLDMQGFELNMLKCSQKALTAKAVYIEVEFVEAYEGQYLYPEVKNWFLENGFELAAIDFDEEVALKGKEAIWPGNGILFYGNCIFVKSEIVNRL